MPAQENGSGVVIPDMPGSEQSREPAIKTNENLMAELAEFGVHVQPLSSENLAMDNRENSRSLSQRIEHAKNLMNETRTQLDIIRRMLPDSVRNAIPNLVTYKKLMAEKATVRVGQTQLPSGEFKTSNLVSPSREYSELTQQMPFSADYSQTLLSRYGILLENENVLENEIKKLELTQGQVDSMLIQMKRKIQDGRESESEEEKKARQQARRQFDIKETREDNAQFGRP